MNFFSHEIVISGQKYGILFADLLISPADHRME